MTDIDAIRMHHDYITEKTPAPWRWHGQDNSNSSVYLATDGHGRVYIMGFARRGLQQAEPMFQVWPESGFGALRKASEGLIRREANHRDDIADIDNPHAEYIKRSPEYVGALLARVDEQAAEIERLRAVAEAVTALTTAALQAVNTNPLHTDLALRLRAALTSPASTEPQYLIWSAHHKMWWGPDGAGYRSFSADAGRYALADTAQWLTRGCGDCIVPEVVVPAPPAGMVGMALDVYARTQIRKATDCAINEGRINRHVRCGEVGTSFDDDDESINTEPCRMTLDHDGDHDWARAEAAEIKRLRAAAEEQIDAAIAQAEAAPIGVQTVHLDGVSR